MNNFNFVTDGSREYSLAENNWFAVEQDDEKVMLVDTDCRKGKKFFEVKWSYNECDAPDGENGQALLDYANCIADMCFEDIKYAIIPRAVIAGTGKIENAYMWPMDRRDFSQHRSIGGKIFAAADYDNVWTCTLYGINGINHIAAWCIDNDYGEFSPYNVNNMGRIAPAFYLKKSAIDYVTEDGVIVLQKESEEEKQESRKDFTIDSNAYKLNEITTYVEHLINSNLTLSQVTKTNHLSDDALQICAHVLSLAK